MLTFTPAAFATHLQKIQKTIEDRSRANLNILGAAVAEDARQSIGTYQQAIGPYTAWTQLAASTLYNKAKSGLGKNGNPDTPLYATGAMAASIEYKVPNAQQAHVGSDDETLIWMEEGTTKMPPRPVLGPAALRTVPKFTGMFGRSIAAVIAGADGRANVYVNSTYVSAHTRSSGTRVSGHWRKKSR